MWYISIIETPITHSFSAELEYLKNSTARSKFEFPIDEWTAINFNDTFIVCTSAGRKQMSIICYMKPRVLSFK